MMVTKFSLQIQDSKRLGWPAGALKHTIILSKALIIKINIDWKMKHDNIVEWGHNSHEKKTHIQPQHVTSKFSCIIFLQVQPNPGSFSDEQWQRCVSSWLPCRTPAKPQKFSFKFIFNCKTCQPSKPNHQRRDARGEKLNLLGLSLNSPCSVVGFV